MRNYTRELILQARDNPRTLLEKRKFWRRTVYEAFLDEITNLLYVDGQKAYDLASYAPPFAELVATETGDDLNILMVGAYGHLGSAHFVLADYPASDEAFDKANTYLAPPFYHADIDIRRAYLRTHQGEPVAAHGFSDQAVKTYQQSDQMLVERHPLGLALAARGYTHYYNGRPGPATVDLSASLALINLRTKSRTYYFALHNMTLYMLDTMPSADLSQTLHYLKISYRRFPKRHIAKFKLLWLEALGYKRVGATRHAERLFKRAFNGFVEMKAPSEVAMISLDIGLFFLDENRFEETRKLALDAYKIVKGIAMDTGGLAAMALWRDATIADLSPDFLTSIRASVVENTKPYGL